MKKYFFLLLAFYFFTNLHSQGFIFLNRTGSPINLEIEADDLNGDEVREVVKLEVDQDCKRERFTEIDRFSAVVYKKDQIPLKKTWNRDIKGRIGKIGKIKIYVSEDKLRYKTYWNNTESCCSCNNDNN